MQRTKADDGTKRMILELQKINGKDYGECVRSDVHNAAHVYSCLFAVIY